MKILKKTVFLLLLFCLAGTASVYAQVKDNKAKRRSDRGGSSLLIQPRDIYVTCSLESPHAVAGENKKFRRGNNGVKYATQWLVTEIEFSFGNTYKNHKGRVYLPNVNVELYMKLPLIDNHFFYGVQKLEGILIDTVQKPKVYAASLFMPPNSVYMYVTAKKSDKASLNGIEGVVVISDKSNKIIGLKPFFIGKNKSTATEKDLLNAVQKMRASVAPAVALWPREKTPWQWIEPDRFELPAIDLNVPKTAAAPASKPAPAKKDDDEEEE